MINWDDAIIHEPAATLLLSESNLHETLKTGFKMNMAKFLCHSQDVERHIKLVSEALATVCGQETRDGFIRTQIQSRKEIPKFESKQQKCELCNLKTTSEKSNILLYCLLCSFTTIVISGEIKFEKKIKILLFHSTLLYTIWLKL